MKREFERYLEMTKTGMILCAVGLVLGRLCLGEYVTAFCMVMTGVGFVLARIQSGRIYRYAHQRLQTPESEMEDRASEFRYRLVSFSPMVTLACLFISALGLYGMVDAYTTSLSEQYFVAAICAAMATGGGLTGAHGMGEVWRRADLFKQYFTQGSAS